MVSKRYRYADECNDDRGPDLRPEEFCFDGQGPEGLPKWFRFHCPRESRECQVPINGQRLPNGATWKFDGCVDTPTLTPSINCNGAGGCGWHGWVRRGEVTDA